MATVDFGGINNVQISSGPTGLEGMDLETALMAVQGRRAENLEIQLKGQMDAVSAKNKEIERLNGIMSNLNIVQSNLTSGGHKPETAYDFTPSCATGTWKPGYDALAAAKLAAGTTGSPNATAIEALRSGKTGDLSTYITNLKQSIDSLSNSQQTDMLRLQSLSNKRNEAFDIMTNFMKKLADNRGSIIGNMR